MPNIFNILTWETRCICCYRVRRMGLFRRSCTDYRVRRIGLFRRACADCRRNAGCSVLNCREVEDRFDDTESMLASEYAAWRQLRRMGLNLPAGNPRYLEDAMRRELANLLLAAGYQGLGLAIAYPQYPQLGRSHIAYRISERPYQPGAAAERCPSCAVTMTDTVADAGQGLIGHICAECWVIWLLSAPERTVNELNWELAAMGLEARFQLPGNGSLEVELRKGR